MSEMVTASHILLMYAGSMRSTASRSKEEAQTLIADLKEKVAAGEDFADLARQHSDCPSGAEGGNLGPFQRGMMVPEFDKAAFELEVGTVSDVVETDFGYHLIYRSA